MLQLIDIHMGENSQPKPESDVIFKKSLSIGLTKFSLEKSLRLGREKFGLKKKSQNQSRKYLFSKKVRYQCRKHLSQYRARQFLVSKKVSVSVSDEISGLVTL